MFPILPAGQILEIEENGNIRGRFFLEVLNAEEDEHIVTIPAGKYSCLQIELDPNLDFIQIMKENWNESGKKTFIINNVMLEKYNFETRASELQKVELDISLW